MYKWLINIIRQTKKSFEKKHMKGTKIYLKTKTKKRVSIIVIEIRNFPKNKKIRKLSM